MPSGEHPADPRGLADEDLERRLRERAATHARELVIELADDSTWSAWLNNTPGVTDPTLGEPRHDGAATKREALEQLWLGLEVEDDLRRYRRER